MVGFVNALPGTLAQGLIWGIMAIGVYLTYRIMDIPDLTVDGSMATGAATFVVLASSGMNLYICLLIAFLSGCAAGFMTGIFHTIFGIPAILSGILTQLALYSVNLRIMAGQANTPINFRQYNLLVTLSNIPKSILVGASFVLVIIAVLYWFFGTQFGATIRATGANETMARANGINTGMNKVLGLAISNGIVALSGALLAQYQGNADINMARGAIVIGLAAVIIGEVLFSKRFKNFAVMMLSVTIGSIIYYMVLSIVLQAGLNANDLKLFSAVVVAIFLAIPFWKNKFFKKGGDVSV